MSKSTPKLRKTCIHVLDEGGWNNLRMSMETAVAMAYVMGRTLVLPPVQGIYLLQKVSGVFIVPSRRYENPTVCVVVHLSLGRQWPKESLFIQ